MKHLRIKTKHFQRASLTLLTLVMVFTTQTAWADYGWWNGSMSIGGKITDPTSWSTDGNNPTDIGTVTDMTITSIAFNVWDDSNDRGGANMFFRVRNGGSSQVGEDQDLWLGASTRITGDHDFAISWTGTENLADAVGLTLEAGKTYYIDMYAKTYGDAGDHWYSNNSGNFHAKITIALESLPAKKALGDNLWTTFYCSDQTYQLDKTKACAYYATLESSKVILHKLGSDGDVIPKGTAVIIVGNNPNNKTTANISINAIDDVSGLSANGNILNGKDESKQVSVILGDYPGYNIYMLSDKNGFGFYPLGNTMTVPARKAYILIEESVLSTRGFSIEFEDDGTTGIRTIDNGPTDNDSWYSLDGRKFNGKPTAKGVYINNGKKIILK